MYKNSIDRKERGNNEMRSIVSHQTSFHSIQEPLYEPTSTLFRELSKKLEEASTVLPFNEFSGLLKKTIHRCIKKAEVDSTFAEAIPNIKKWISLYSHDLEILARVLILEAVAIVKELPHEALEKLNKVKHMLIETEVDFLIVKVLVGESRVHQIIGDREMKLRTLKKCIEYGENYTLEYLKQATQIRLQIADNMMIAYFETFKMLKESKPNSSIEYLSKAYQAAIKNYGHEHFSSQTLANLLHQHRNIISNIQRITPKALSEIQIVNLKKKYTLCILYSWEEELIVVQLEKIAKAEDRRILAEVLAPCKLDNDKIKILKAKAWNDWIEINGNNIRIFEDNLSKIVQPEEVQKMPEKASLRTVDKGELFKRNSVEDESSSSDDDEIILPEQQKFLRYYRDRSQLNRSKSKSRDQQSTRH